MITSTWLNLLLPILVSGNKHLHPRIIRGHNAAEGQFPFIASVHNENPYSDGLFCSAVIIHKKWILTAGHCFNGISYSSSEATQHVVVGTIFRNKGQKYAASKVIVHPKFSQTQAHIGNDLALIRLAKPLALSKTVQPIALGSLPKDETTFVEAGWGQTKSPRKTDILQFVDLKIIEIEQCQKIHAQFNNIVDGATQICVCSDNEATPCFGDSGGPLVSKSTGRLVGVFSGMEDCSGKYPVLFVNVSAFVKWIESETGLKLPLN